MLILKIIAYLHPNRELLFNDLQLIINDQQKVALVGNNGVGKSTLLKLVAGMLQPSSGEIHTEAQPYYVPQLFGQFNHLTIVQALKIEEKLKALHEMLDGNTSDSNLALLDDDWTIEERCHQALAHWKLEGFELTQKMEGLSGGEKTKVFLAGISIHQPRFVLLDEPSNHLDAASRQLLYDFIRQSAVTFLVVSHDRKLLNMLSPVCELNRSGITVYGGNYAFYHEQKNLERSAVIHDVKAKEKALRKAKETEREAIERKQKLDARGKKKQDKAGMPTIMMNTLRNNAEKSTSRMKSMHAAKVEGIFQELNELRKELPGADKMKFGFDNSTLHKGKILFEGKDINYRYGKQKIWNKDLHFQVISGDRLALKGPNGSGKTTLIKIMLGKMDPASGSFYRGDCTTVYIDQDYSLINNHLQVYGQAEQFNQASLQEHEIKIRLSRFLFDKDYWDKPCSALSGGEKMRLMLCCLTIGHRAPDVIVLDEPTNNLDLQNIDILKEAINEYEGTLIVISHDETFLQQVNVKREIYLEQSWSPN